MENKSYRPYIVSADVEGLMQQWSTRTGYLLPNSSYFSGLLTDLKATLGQYFSIVEIIPQEFLRVGLRELAKNSRTPVISLDRAYIRGDEPNVVGFLDASRAVDTQLDSCGLISRRRDINIERQTKQISKKLANRKVTLLDDVIFEGKTILNLSELFLKQGIVVENVFTGIAIQEGIDLLQRNGIQVNPLLLYDQVIDEICERDFVVGSPLSGRSVVDEGRVYGAPYLYPFGKPIEWASIPQDKATEFSLFCLTQSLLMWQEAERSSRSTIPTKALAKPVYKLPESKSIVQSVQLAINTFKRKEEL